MTQNPAPLFRESVVIGDSSLAFVRRAGPGPTLVFLHGAALTHRQWSRQLATFGARYDCVAPDLRGHGDSRTPPGHGPYLAATLADDVAALLDHLGVGRAHVVGVSLGAIVGQEFALRHALRCASLFSVGGPNDTGSNALLRWYSKRIAERMHRGIAEQGMVYVADLTARTSPRDVQERSRQYFRADMGRTDPDEFRRVYDGVLAYHGVRRRLNELAVPARFAAGKKDWVRFQSRQSSRLVSGASYRSIPEAGHVANIDNPDAFEAALAEWLDEVAAI